MENESVNLTKFLSSAGVASRRHSTDLIKEGHVVVNGEVQTNPGTRITENDRVSVDGKEIRMRTKRHYVMLHKPRGYVCTSEDEHAAKKAIDLIQLKDGARLFSAGRLDKNSEGLILFSDDGDFVEQLTHPRHGIEKTYEVSTDRPLTQDDISRMLKGIPNAGDLLKALAVRTLSPTKYQLVLGEGKNREIRRMMDALGHSTNRLKRVAVGRLTLRGLDVGEWRELTKEECLLALQKTERQQRIQQRATQRTTRNQSHRPRGARD